MGLIEWRNKHRRMSAFKKVKEEIWEFSIDPTDLLREILKFDDETEMLEEMEDLNDGLDAFQRIASETMPNWWEYEP